MKTTKHPFKFQNYKPEEFQDHISRSIPNYRGMRDMIPSIASNFLVKNSNIYDIGCSAGDLLLELEECFRDVHNDLSYVGYDIADNLLPDKEYLPNHSFFPRDVTEESLTLFNTSLIFSLFTLQFIPLPKRIKLVQKIYDSLDERGAFIVCEKIYSNNSITEDIFTFSNYDSKQVNDFSTEEILSKQKDLRGIMFPLTQGGNEKMFKDAGFQVVEVFFKSLNFIGWILIK
jgi:tRNA (cmo5U34)-methyltransferase